MMKTFRKAAALLVALLLLVPAVAACQPSYATVDQTADDARTVYEIGDDAVTFDHFRMEFLTALAAEEARGTVIAALSGEEKAALYGRLAGEALDACCRLYAIFALCREQGIDPYSHSVDADVSVRRREAISELTADDPYRAYLDGLSAVYSSDWLYRLELRAYLCREAFSAKTGKEGGAFYPTEDGTVTNYFLGDDVVSVVWMYRDYSYSAKPRAEVYADMQSLRARAMEKEGNARRAFFGGYSDLSEHDLQHGLLVGRHPTLEYSRALIEAAFSLGVGEISDVIESGTGYYVLLRVAKDEEEIRAGANDTSWLDRYLEDAVWAAVDEKAAALKSAASVTEFGASLDFAALTEGTPWH